MGKAVTEMNVRIIVSKPPYVALAQRKEDRKAHLAQQYVRRVSGMRMQQGQFGQMDNKWHNRWDRWDSHNSNTSCPQPCPNKDSSEANPVGPNKAKGTCNPTLVVHPKWAVVVKDIKT